MGRLTFQVTGESHGPELGLMLTGLPAGMEIPRTRIDHWLSLRRLLAGRGPRAPQEDGVWTVAPGGTARANDARPLAIFLSNRDPSR